MTKFGWGYDWQVFACRLRGFFESKEYAVWNFYKNSAKVQKKSGDELVGELDKIMEKDLEIFLTGIKDYPVVGEESSFEKNSKWPPKEKNFWLVDPIDGTHNFLGEIPSFGSIVALIEEGNVVFGAVYIFAEQRLGLNGQLYYACRGQGARKFGSWKYDPIIPLCVSGVKDIENSTVLAEGPSKLGARCSLIQNIWLNAGHFKKGLSSSVAITKIANGGNVTLSADILIMCGNKPWDSLAGALIVEEAGGVVTGFDDKPYSLENCSDLIYTNKILHPKILALG